MPLWGWAILVFAAFAVIGMVLERIEASSAKGKEQAALAAMGYTGKIPMQGTVPDVAEVIRVSKALFTAGYEAQAYDLLHTCRNLCSDLDLTSSVGTLSNEIIGLRHQKQADAAGSDVLAVLSQHPEGILQTALYQELPGINQDIVRFACYRLAENGQIVREKKGRSYLVRLAGQAKVD